MTDNKSNKTFLVGPAAKRELRRALVKSTNPAETIANFQSTKSLHSMFAKAFGTRPHYAAGGGDDDQMEDKPAVEPLDTDSVLLFLTHLGVNQHEVHKRLSDALQKQLEDDIRKITSEEPLLNLLKSCWNYATTLPELRPVLWAVLKQLGPQTPLAVLTALAEREKDGTMKHAEIFRPLPPLLKRLVWEADWDDKVPIEKEQKIENPKEYLDLVESTLLCETVGPLVEEYCSNQVLVDSVSHPFVSSARERRIATTQRRALAASSSTSGAAAGGSVTALANKASASSSSKTPSDTGLSSGKAVSKLRGLLGDTTGGTASYRPKLLHATLSMLMARHGALAKLGGGTSKLVGSNTLLGPHLHCTLVADILLAAGGPLPKAYQHVLSLARALDDVVRLGNLSDSDLIKIQGILTLILQPGKADDEDDDSKTEKEGDDSNDGKAKSNASSSPTATSRSPQKKEAKPSTFLKRQLNRIITAGLEAMKESDPQSLFLNPVTDEIAPGYSKVIKKPMCISTMEEKIETSDYNAIAEWEADTKLMFQNCQEYNKGKAGQWFRDEAKRQHKVYKDEILPQARRLYQIELTKRNPDDDDRNKRKREEETSKPAISPLPAATRKRKKISQEQTPSMPALASMLLADPFVVRILLDRVLRNLRTDVLKGSFVPVAHSVVPSLLQLLHMANWSAQLCAIGGRRYIVPDGGITKPSQESAELEVFVPYDSLRRCMPVVMHLLLESELDKRLVAGGDLNAVVQEDSESVQTKHPTVSKREKGSPPLNVAISLLEGAFFFICLPGNSQDASLSVTFPKFAKTLDKLAANVWEERPFFRCIVQAILRHKTRLNRTTRDAIVSTWVSWLKGKKKKKSKIGSITSAAHESLVHLLNEWAALGNLLMPRDLLLKVSSELVEAVDNSEASPERKFVIMWKREGDQGETEQGTGFRPIKEQYERMLDMLPETHRKQWKEKTGISEAMHNNEADQSQDVEKVEEEPKQEDVEASKEDPMEEG